MFNNVNVLLIHVGVSTIFVLTGKISIISFSGLINRSASLFNMPKELCQYLANQTKITAFEESNYGFEDWV